MHIETFDRLRDADRIRTIWNSLSDNMEISYFLSWAWMENWLATLPASLPVSLHAVFEGEQPSAAFFLGTARIVRRKFFWSRARFLNASGDKTCDDLCIEYNAFLCRPGSVLPISEVLRLLPGKWDEVIFPALDAALTPGNLIADVRHPFRVVVERDAPSRYVDLDKVRGSAQGYLSLLSKKARYHVRRSLEFYQTRGEIVCEVATTYDRACAVFEELMTLHQNSWAERGEPGAFASGYFISFHRELIRKRFEHGEIQLARVSCGAETIGCIYAFVRGGNVYFYQSGLSYPREKQVRPGFVSLVKLIQHNADCGNRTFDFLGGNAIYKKSLATDERRLIWVRIQKPRLRFAIENTLARFKKKLADDEADDG